jgi:hypothetical protein
MIYPKAQQSHLIEIVYADKRIERILGAKESMTIFLKMGEKFSRIPAVNPPDRDHYYFDAIQADPRVKKAGVNRLEAIMWFCTMREAYFKEHETN